MTARVPPHEIPSPCIGICALDEAGAVCVGCGRTLDEIATWGSASAERKRAILERLAKAAAGKPADGRGPSAPST